MECAGKNGLHIWADHFLPEVVDPKTGEVLEEGQEGELVITTLTKEAMPLIRYRTGDLVSLTSDICNFCGRTMPRISKLTGRIDDMLSIRGVNIVSSQIESALMSIPEVAPHYQIILTTERHLDRMEILVEVVEEVFSDEVKKLEELERKVISEIESTLGISVKIRFCRAEKHRTKYG